MNNVDIYFKGLREPKHIFIENVIMIQTINNELVILYKVESFDYNYTEVKRYSTNVIDYYVVEYHK